VCALVRELGSVGRHTDLEILVGVGRSGRVTFMYLLDSHSTEDLLLWTFERVYALQDDLQPSTHDSYCLVTTNPMQVPRVVPDQLLYFSQLPSWVGAVTRIIL
jgi:hypothetical protein